MVRAVTFIVLVLCHVKSSQAQNDWDNDVDSLKQSIEVLGRQVMMQQLSMEERVRSSGDSGIKIIRLNTKGTNPYLTETYTRKSNSAIHDHSNNIRTVGMGEVAVVLNGVEFRTRHNDYRLYMPSKSDSQLNSVEDVPFPDVPKEVTDKLTVQDQIDEMRLWFKAFKEQKHTERDYRKYFKPVLCYLEGKWTFSDENKIEEPFASDRHQIDASSWFDLHDKIRFTSGTGSKSNGENFAFLPTTIAGFTNETFPVFAQWNYRILCHPLNRDIPLNRFQMIDDFASRMVREYTIPQQELTRSARFQLNPLDTDDFPEALSYNTGLLDELMYEIPGLDNYQASIVDDAFGGIASQPTGESLNAGYYHRIFKTSKKGANGLQLIHRGFNDQNLFVALNTQPNIMGVSYKSCTDKESNNVCTDFTQRVSYAIPLEIIYLSPLYNWNPHNIIYRGSVDDDDAAKVKADGRNGSPTTEKAYDGTHSKLYYRTPVEFFGGVEVGRDPADTASNKVSVLGGDGKVKNVTVSGTRIFLPVIGDLGTIRLRYPINPVHDEGSVTRKELEALKTAFLEMGNYMHMLRVPVDITKGGGSSKATVLKTGPSNFTNVYSHFHTLEVSTADLDNLILGEEVSAYTSIGAGHHHYITYKFVKSENAYKIMMCDNQKFRCWDNHPRYMTETTA